MRPAFPTFSNQTAARWHSLVSDGKRIDRTINFVPTRPADLEHVVVTDYLHFIAHRARPRLCGCARRSGQHLLDLLHRRLGDGSRDARSSADGRCPFRSHRGSPVAGRLPRRARRPRAPAREGGRHSVCGAAVETNLVTFTSAIGGARNALVPPHRVRTSRRARRALASTRRPPPPVAQIAGSASARGVMSSTADLRSRSGRPVDDDDLCTAVAAVEPTRDLLEGLPHVWGGSPLGRPQFGGSANAARARSRLCSFGQL